MEKTKTVKVVELRGQAEHLQKTLNDLKKDFSNLATPQDLQKIFDKLGTSIDALKKKTEKGVISREDFAASEKEIGKIKVAFDQLENSMEGLAEAGNKKLLSLIPKETTEKIKKVTEAYDEYAKMMGEVVRAEEAVAKAKAKQSETQSRANSATSNVENFAKVKAQAQAEFEGHNKVTDALNEQEKAAQALKKATEELNEAKLQNKSQKVIATKQGVFDSADARKKKADETVANFDSSVIDKQKKAQEALTIATNNLAAAERDKKQADKDAANAIVEVTNAENTLQQVMNSSQETVEKQGQSFSRLLKALADVDPKFKGISLTGETTKAKLDELRVIVGSLSTNEIQKLRASLGNAKVNFDSFQAEVAETKTALDSTKASLQAQDAALAQQSAFENRIKQFLGLRGAANALRKAFRDAIKTIKELDAAMTEIAVVTNFDVGDMWEQLPQFSDRASELGVSITEAYKASALFYQQGLKTNEVIEMSNEALKMARIAGLSAKDATDKMTAALRGFNMELNETSAQKINDVYSELAAITASDVGEISSAMTKTASIAASAGMQFETTAAFLSQVIETTRESAETAGTALKTVIARFQELKKSPDEIGEVDGEIVDANAIEKALRSVGVSLRNTSGQFRDLDEVFLELSSKWDSLDKNTQRYIATIAAGSRQQSRFIAMMSDYSRTTELVQAANTSAGASQRQFEKTTDSLQTKIERLKNAWHEFTMGIMNSDFVKFGVDVLTKLLEVINKITEGIAGFGGGLTKVAATLALFKMGTKIFTQFKGPLMSMFTSIATMAGIEGEKAGKAFYDGVARARDKITQEQQATQNVPASGQKQKEKQNNTLFAQTGVVSSATLMGRMQNTGARMVGGDHFADSWAAHKRQQSAKATMTALGGSREKLVARQQIISGNLTAAKEKKEELVKQRNSEKGKMGAAKKQMKGLDPQSEKWKKANAVYEKSNKKLTELNGTIKKQEGIIDKTAKAEESATKNIEKYDNAQEEATTNGKQKMESLQEGVAQASQALMAGGMAVGMLGQAFVDAGAEEFGEGMQKVGSIMTTLGAILGFVNPLIALMKPLFAGAGTAGVNSGMASTAAWGVVGAIVMIVMAAILVTIAIILVVIAIINNNSPEKKLEESRQAAAELSEAADEAADSFNNLNKALEALDDKYDNLDNLVKGTEEWNEAVKEINDSVLDLINEYPELAQFVENNGGVLTIDMNSQGVQGVLTSMQKEAIALSNAALKAEMSTMQLTAQVQLDQSDLGKALYYDFDDEDDDGIYKIVEAVSEAVAKGEIDVTEASRQLEDSGYTLIADAFRENAVFVEDFGKEVIESKKKMEAYHKAMSAKLQQIINMDDFSEEQQNAITNFTSSAEWSKALDAQAEAMMPDVDLSGSSDGNIYDNLDAKQTKYFNEAIASVYGDEARVEGTTIYYLQDGKQEEAELSDSVVKDKVFNTAVELYKTDLAEGAGENAVRAMQELDTKFGDGIGTKLFSGKGQGESLTYAEVTKVLGDDLKLTETELSTMWTNLSDDAKAGFGDSQDLFADHMKKFTNQFDQFTDLNDKLIEMGVDGDAVKTLMDKGYTTEQLAQFKTNLEKLDASKRQSVINTYEDFMEQHRSLTKEQQSEILSLVTATDFTSKEALSSLQVELAEAIGLPTSETESFIQKLQQLTNAQSKLGSVVDTYGDLFKATNKVNDATRKLTQLQWEYSRAITQNNADLKDNIASQLDAYTQQAEGLSEKPAAIQENIQRLYAQGVAKSGNDYTKFFKIGASGLEALDPSMDFEEYLRKLNGKDSEAGKEFVEWYDSIQEQYDSLEEVSSEMRDMVDGIDELLASLEEAYNEVYEAVRTGLQDTMQKSLDDEIAANDAMTNSFDQLVTSVQDAISQERQRRENEKTEEAISDTQARLAYLGMDTSGANALAIKETEQLLKDQQQDYTDSLIDQTLQQMTEDNQKAYEQRERQIDIAQQQLDAYWLSAEFEEKVAYATDDIIEYGPGSSYWESTLEANTDSMAQKEADFWKAQFGTQVGQASVFKEYKDALSNLATSVAGNTNKSIEPNVAQIAKLMLETKEQSKVGSANSLGLNSSLYGSSDVQTNIDRADATTSFVEKSGTMSGVGYSDEQKDRVKWLNENAGQLMQDLENEAGWSTKTESEKQEAYSRRLNEEYEKYANAKIADQELKDQIDSVAKRVVSGGGKVTEQNLATAQKSIDKGGTYISDTAQFKQKVYEKARSQMKLKDLGTARTSVRGVFYGDGGSRYVIQDFDEKNDILGGVNDWLDDIVFVKRPNDGNALNEILGINSAKDVSDQYYWYKNQVYWSYGDAWWATYDGGTGEQNEDKGYFIDAVKKHYKIYETGGLADFTGPAWLDGTKSKPEYVLNAAQTERFFSLVDVLERLDTNDKPIQTNQEVTVDIDINVEKISNDYDVEQMANKIRKLLYEDSMYRNVNNINLIR